MESTEKDYTTPINFTNWGILYEKEEPQVHDNFCPFMYSDGLWGYERLEECERTKLCFICSYIKTPVFTLKGQCPNSSLFEWNYYMTKKANSEFSHFVLTVLLEMVFILQNCCWLLLLLIHECMDSSWQSCKCSITHNLTWLQVLGLLTDFWRCNPNVNKLFDTGFHHQTSNTQVLIFGSEEHANIGWTSAS